jgi:hypothetical protein
LPPKTEIIELIRLEGAQRDLYETQGPRSSRHPAAWRRAPAKAGSGHRRRGQWG